MSTSLSTSLHSWNTMVIFYLKCKTVSLMELLTLHLSLTVTWLHPGSVHVFRLCPGKVTLVLVMLESKWSRLDTVGQWAADLLLDEFWAEPPTDIRTLWAHSQNPETQDGNGSQNLINNESGPLLVLLLVSHHKNDHNSGNKVISTRTTVWFWLSAKLITNWPIRAARPTDGSCRDHHPHHQVRGHRFYQVSSNVSADWRLEDSKYEASIRWFRLPGPWSRIRKTRWRKPCPVALIRWEEATPTMWLWFTPKVIHIITGKNPAGTGPVWYQFGSAPGI